MDYIDYVKPKSDKYEYKWSNVDIEFFERYNIKTFEDQFFTNFKNTDDHILPFELAELKAVHLGIIEEIKKREEYFDSDKTV